MATGYLVQTALYCEYSALHEAKRQGRVPASEARSIARKALRTIRGSRDGWTTVRLAGEVLGVPVIVSPDALLIRDGKPAAILKARVRPSMKQYPGDWAPLYLAGAVLDELTGSADGSLKLILILARDREALAAAAASVKGEVAPSRTEDWIISTRIYTREDAARILRRPLGVISGLLTPRPPPPGRCARCRWRRTCPWAQREEQDSAD